MRLVLAEEQWLYLINCCGPIRGAVFLSLLAKEKIQWELNRATRSEGFQRGVRTDGFSHTETMPREMEKQVRLKNLEVVESSSK